MEFVSWVYGDGVDETFRVCMSPTQPVASLKRFIKYKEPVRFHNVDPDKFDLYSIPYYDDGPEFEDELEQWTLKDKIPLEPRMKISVLQDCLVIVNPPSCADPSDIVPVMTLNFWPILEEGCSILSVKVPRTVTVGFLQQVIKAQKRELNANFIALYKVRIPNDCDYDKVLQDNDSHGIERLNVMTVLSDLFPNGPAQGHIHFILNVFSTLSYRLGTYSDKEILGLEPRRLQDRRRIFAAFFQRMPSLAEGVERIIKRQEDRTQAIYHNRPHSTMASTPVTLLHPVFGQFLDDCETHETTRDDNCLVNDLEKKMSQYYASQGDRAREICKVFAEWGLDINTPKTASYEAGGHRHYLHHVIAEFRDEIGSPGEEDPYDQASVRYMRLMESHAPQLGHSALPSLIVLVIGPFISFAGAAWDARPVIQPLSVCLPFHYHWTDTRMRTRVARHLGAFRKAAHTLQEYYKCLQRIPEVIRVTQLLPYPTHFQGNDGRRVDFEYDDQFEGSGLLFFGRFGDDRPICIKFATKYSKDAHLACASMGCAPTLHAFETLPGGWSMVIMDRLFGDEYKGLGDTPPTTSLMESIRGTLEQLHQRGYVHGDVRDANILVSKRDETKFMFVDFDWAGRIGEVRYPAGVNRKNIWRPEGAVDGALVRAEHDMDMLDAMMKKDEVTDEHPEPSVVLD